MTHVSSQDRQPAATTPYRPTNRVRFLTAASLFDGHDVSVNIMRRILQTTGVEVIHLGHNRSVEEIVTAAVQEDVQGVAISSYQGGHMEFFKYTLDLLRERDAGNVMIFGGGGGVITPPELDELHAYGISRLYSPEDGARLGLQGMMNDVVSKADYDLTHVAPKETQALLAGLATGGHRFLARVITALENGGLDEEACTALRTAAAGVSVPVLGITGTGGAGKSSLTDELVRRFRLDRNEQLKIAIISIDPSRKRTGGALLGDRIRMNAINHPNIFMRSLATRETGAEISPALAEVIAATRLAGFDLVIVETSGIGQGNAAIVPYVDLSLYVMTPEFGAASQLEKIDMLDFADLVAINKFDRKGAEDALRDVSRQVQRNREAWGESHESMPVFGTMASRFNDDGVTALYQALVPALEARGLPGGPGRLPRVDVRCPSASRAIIPPSRTPYLSEIAECVRTYRADVETRVRTARDREALQIARSCLETGDADLTALDAALERRTADLGFEARSLLETWPTVRKQYEGEQHVVRIRDRDICTELTRESLSGTRIPKVSLPRYGSEADLLRFLMLENLPGYFPFTAGVFPFKREGEDPTRMFAGEGDAFRTNRRFRKLSEGMPAHRLSTAFDSVTLYGCDPAERPDIYGKVGNAGVSIATLDDMKVLYEGFDLCAPSTSVSMTINGPAPVAMAFFFNTAIDQQMARFQEETGREPTPEERDAIRARTLSTVRGTIQADILKEDQGQNTCIFATEFALKLMGDIQEYFVRNDVRNFYSVSISGYHIAEAGANPITQLAFTLANGFTYVESYLARGMDIDAFAPNLSFFFSNGMDPEYSVIGRVARRIWAIAMRNRYGANERSCKLKYHVQTSGRSLHAQEMDFNDIRTTLQALIAIYDNCNSLHTNAYDEAITTPTEESVRRAMAIQLIINREWGVAMNENPNQGSFLIDELTDLVEEAVLKEFDALSSRGGVLGAMETGYQRGRIQDESLYYEHRKHDGSYPIIGVNTFLNPHGREIVEIELARSTEDEKQSQLRRLKDFQTRHSAEAPFWQARLREAVINDENVFDTIMEAVRHCSMGQVTEALFQVGGQYRRNM
ncbi:methylmalonyl-CoA mutase family protein [Phaeovibrio sulfidiphilus]|uniref:Fused isobutyryl-CoA mutase n=1 Tax=Phaeovibrio sulfidiphilus TaxID=1220600 RepID=A0A8J6YNF5_9PROT|nr:fused isobutyryl-CoA mutase/GTPase IcmF [Phaeovibrio sulfidiphilus]MBE1237855.1 methylmalonyl-CoA mutase family protein [Phaeovibrio sulfidiphilus]